MSMRVESAAQGASSMASSSTPGKWWSAGGQISTQESRATAVLLFTPLGRPFCQSTCNHTHPTQLKLGSLLILTLIPLPAEGCTEQPTHGGSFPSDGPLMTTYVSVSSVNAPFCRRDMCISGGFF